MMKWRPTENPQDRRWIIGVELLLLPIVLLTPLMILSVWFTLPGLIFLATAVFPFFSIRRAHTGQRSLRTGTVVWLLGASAAKAAFLFFLTFTVFSEESEVGLVFLLGVWWAVLAFFSYGLLKHVRTWNMTPPPADEPSTFMDWSE